MRTGRPIPLLTLTADERETLERWTRRPTTARALAERARVVLECAAGKPNTVVARELRLTKQTIGKWRSRFLRQRLDGLLDEPRPGAPRRIGDAEVERVMRLTLETAPREATHWSTRAMARRCGLSQTAVSRIWRAFSLRPHRVKTFKLSKDPLFIEKVRDIVGSPSIRPIKPSCCASTRRRRSKPWTAPSRSCRCVPGRWSDGRTMTPGTARPRSLPR